MNLPNQLTVARLVMVPLFVVFMSIDHVLSYVFGYVVFTAASITDLLDGKIARRRGMITSFGKLADPLADKVLMAAAFVMVMKVPNLDVPGWTIVAILAREFLVTGARSLAASEGSVIAASSWGKAKTVIQMVYIYAFLFLAIAGMLCEQWLPDFAANYNAVLGPASLIAIVFVAVFTVYSGVEFARANWRVFDLGNV